MEDVRIISPYKYAELLALDERQNDSRNRQRKNENKKKKRESGGEKQK